MAETAEVGEGVVGTAEDLAVVEKEEVEMAAEATAEEAMEVAVLVAVTVEVAMVVVAMGVAMGVVREEAAKVEVAMVV